MKNLTNALTGLGFLRRHNAIFDVTHGILTFPCPSMQLQPDTQKTLCQAKPLLAENTHTPQPGDTTAIASRMSHLLDHDATAIVNLSPQFEHNKMKKFALNFRTHLPDHVPILAQIVKLNSK